MSCPTTTFCVGVDGAGNVLTSTNPAEGASAWTIFNVGSGSSLLTGVSCSTANLCVAVDGSGHVYTSTGPAGGHSAWSAATVDPGQVIAAVSCPRVSFCVAGDEEGDVLTSTAPTVASSWTVTQVPAMTSIDPVACVTGLCVAAGSSSANASNPGAVAYSITPATGSSWKATGDIQDSALLGAPPGSSPGSMAPTR